VEARNIAKWTSWREHKVHTAETSKKVTLAPVNARARRSYGVVEGMFKSSGRAKKLAQVVEYSLGLIHKGRYMTSNKS
jgi:hypothetical protein